MRVRHRAALVYKASANCKEEWRYVAGTAVVGFDTRTLVFGAGGTNRVRLDL